MSDIRTFRAGTMQEALDVVRREMGADAVILHTRQVERRRFLPWKKPLAEVEVTAGLDVNVREHAASGNGARQRNRPPAEAASPAAQPQRTSASDILRELESRGSLDSLAAELERTSSAAVNASMARPSAYDAGGSPAGAQPAGNDVSERLDRIQQMLETLGRTTRSASVEVPDELFHVYTDLIDAEVEDEVARELVHRLKTECPPEQLQDAAAAKSLLARMVQQEIRCCPPVDVVPGTRKVVALVGPTGVGKTTTIAKLAANFRLRDSVKMGLVTVDTYRIAAVEQLRTYAEIIDLPMKIVTSPREMRRALDDLAGLDLVLIDTAGRSPRDDLQIQELKSLLGEARCDEVHLVLSMTSSLRSLEATARNFEAAGTTAVVLTKLDEAAGMGPLASLARRIDLPVSYLTTGQDVPDDIEPARADRMARLVLGRDRLDV